MQRAWIRSLLANIILLYLQFIHDLSSPVITLIAIFFINLSLLVANYKIPYFLEILTHL